MARTSSTNHSPSDVRERDANERFANHVQSIAFNLTLSRAMIEGLRLVRDWGMPEGRDISRNHGWAKPKPDNELRSPSGQDLWTTAVQALIRRGLVFHDWIETAPKGHRYFKLTRAGDLVCDLLVEARLLAAAPKQSRRAA
jgi:hypothetical protein